jgi:type II restriction/modification system DNA methylase subunit YeeA
VSKTGGGQGFADVWMSGHFAWEYKGKHKNLDAAYQQLLQYKEDLENPPLLVVCDLDRFEVHTNFTNTAKRVFRFTLADLAKADTTPTSALPPIEVLRALFTDPNRLRPDRTAARVTERAAGEFALIALNLARAT